MEYKFQEGERIRLKKNLTYKGLKKGAIGKVAQQEFYPREFYYVEFTFPDVTTDTVTLTPDYMEKW